MQIAVVSDIHDNLDALAAMLRRVQSAEALICCGDLCSPFTAKELGMGFPGPVHVVFGNNDGDRWRIAANAAKRPNLRFHGEYAELEFAGRRFAVQHFDNIGRAIAAGGAYDVVCFGHNHRSEISRSGRALIVNPGELFGKLSGRSTFALIDPESLEAEIVEL
ncbi:MAG: metallophosphoesterase [Verrucomicrobia bacterium]|nr:metallophosphoesterase [Verrucomicrobiota bacterium]